MGLFRKRRSSGGYYSYSNRTSEYSQYRDRRWGERSRRSSSSSSGPAQELAPMWVVIALSGLLLLPNLLGLFMAQNLTPVWQRLVYLLASVALFLMPAGILRARTFFMVQSPLLLLGIVEVVHLFVNHATTSVLFVYTCLIAEPGEFTELMSNYLPLIILLLLVWAAYFVAVFRLIPRGSWAMPAMWRLGAGACGVALLILTACSSPVRTVVGKVCPFDFYVASCRIHQVSGAISRGQESLADFRFGARAESAAGNELVILVIGETARYDHFGLNGYERPTTPCLSDREHLFSFDSIYTVGNLTTVCVPMMLSSATPQSPRPMADELTVVDAFHEAGYRTAWIANQSYSNRLLRPVADRCDECDYLPPSDPRSAHDFGLLPPLRGLLPDSVRQFVAIHSLGCHFEYNKRYPSEFGIYQPDEGGNLIHDRDLLVNSYDNAIIYTDRFLDSVISLVERTGRPAAVLYVSDHGENLLDDERGMFLHGTYAGSLFEYHVPLFVWLSDAYRERHPQAEASIAANLGVRQSTMTVFHTLLHLGDVSAPVFRSDMSLVSAGLERADSLTCFDANLQCVPLPRR